MSGKIEPSFIFSESAVCHRLASIYLNAHVHLGEGVLGAVIDCDYHQATRYEYIQYVAYF